MSDEHRMLPHASAAEKAVVSAVLNMPTEALTYLSEHGIDARYFFASPLALIFSQSSEMWGQGKAVDMTTVTEALREKGKLEQAGGAPGVYEAWRGDGDFFGLHTLPELAESLRTAFLGRSAIHACISTENRIREEPGSASDAITELSSALSNFGAAKSRFETPKQIVMGVIQRIQDSFENKEAPKDTLSTGFEHIDISLCGGIRGDDYVLITGPTKGGKSILLQSIMERISFFHKRPTVTFSLESGTASSMERVLASQSGVDFGKIRTGFLGEHDFPKLTRAAGRIAESKMFMRDDARALLQLIAVCRSLKQSHPDLAAIGVDYIQLLGHVKEKGQNRETVVAEMSTALRGLGLELQVPVIILSQENDAGQVRESRRLEHDCTIRFKIERVEGDDGVRKICIPIARNAPPAEFLLTFRGNVMQFSNHTPDELDKQTYERRNSPPPRRAKND